LPASTSGAAGELQGAGSVAVALGQAQEAAHAEELGLAALDQIGVIAARGGLVVVELGGLGREQMGEAGLLQEIIGAPGLAPRLVGIARGDRGETA
jgi:hypothetical protein